MIAYKELTNIPIKWSEIQKNLIMIAILGIKDIIRNNVSETIVKCKDVGVNVRMVSSENRTNAISMAKEIGILSPFWMEYTKDYTVI